MSVSYPRRTYANKDSEKENCWQRRSGLERKLIMALTLTAVIATGCILYVVLGLPASKEICTSTACLQSATELTAYMNPGLDPCDDFFKFVCGNINNEIPMGVKQKYEEQLRNKASTELDALMREPIADNDPDLIKDQKKLYQACMQQTGVDKSKEIFQELLDELGGWPVVKNFHWRAKLFDWVETMQILRSEGYPYSMLFNIGVRFSINKPEENMVTVSPPNTDKISREHRHSYLNYMIEVAHIFGAERHRAEIEMTEVLEFMDELYNIDEEHSADYSKGFTWTSGGRTVKEFQEKHNETEWLNLINNLLNPVTNITVDDSVLFPTDAYMKAFLGLMRKTLKRVQANYMIWKVLDAIIPYMSEDLKRLKEDYECQIGNKKMERSDFCKDVMNDVPFRILYARKNLPSEKREQVEDLFVSIKSEFTTSLAEASWMDNESELKAIEKINTVIDIVGSPRHYFNDTIFDEFDAVYQLNDESCNNNFFCLQLNARKRRLNIIYNYLDTSVNGTIFHGWSANAHISYLSNVNVIVLPAGFFQYQFYSEKRPMYLNFGMSGAIIGSALAEGVCKDNLNMWLNDTREELMEYTQCVEKYSTETSDRFLTIGQSIVDHSGIKTAYKAYQNWVKDNGEEQYLPGVRYTPNQLFWVSAMSLKCFSSNNTGDRSDYRILQANAPFQNNIDFANDFKCSLNSEMNPSEKCDIL